MRSSSLLSRAVVTAGLLSLFLATVCPAQPPPAPRVVAGRVLETRPADKWFTLKAGASKRYSQVRVRLDKKTKWSGLPVKNGMPKVGQVVSVTVVPLVPPKEGEFRAVAVNVPDPDQKPGSGRPMSR